MTAEIVGVLGASVVVRGRIEGAGELVVRGCVDGAISLHGSVVVDEGARVLGDVRAGRLEVLGEVVGNVTGDELVAIRPGGRVVGDVRAQSIAIDDGAALHGGIDMDFSVGEGDL